ncbi:MAG TPA: carboxypeptidase-like regulatory domain-containing protein [Solirubrobacterales bacterium]|nr:carboxypeptidase-like regulatory domain-containing protein [Solirubrobacterales bacterium]
MARGIGLLVLLAASPLIWGVASARAGEYTVWSCRGPAGMPISAAAWRTQASYAASGDITITDDCASGGSLRIEATPPGPIADHQPQGEAIFEPPAGTAIAHFEVWRYVAATADDYAASFQEWAFGIGSSQECAAGHAPGCSFGTPEEPLDEDSRVEEHTWNFEASPGEGLPPFEKLGFWVSCVKVGCRPAPSSPSALFELARSAVTIEDDRPPTITRLEGPAAESAPVTGVAHLFVTATDVGGGIAALEFSVDGGASRRVAVGGCEEPFSEPQPCPPKATQGIAIDTAGLAPGEHAVSGAALDAAGNATPFGPVSFTVAPPAVAAPGQQAVAAASAAGGRPDNGTPASEAARLRLHRAGRFHRAGEPGRLQGTLTTPDGVPIAEARLGVEITELGGGHRVRRRVIGTDADGHFALAVAGAGARTVVVSYAPTVGGPVSRRAEALVRTSLSLALKPRPRRVRAGQTVRFLGRLRGAGGAARGANVEIQAIAGGRWTTIDTVTVGRHGSFSWAHRFRYVERDALFSFRAVVPRTPGWPWPTVRSGRIELPIEGSSR